MKKILTPLALLLICHLAFSQQCHLNWGEVENVAKLDNGQFLTGMANNLCYIITANKEKKISKYNTSMGKTAEKDYTLEYEGAQPGGWKGLGLKTFIHTHSNNYVCYQYNKPKDLKSDIIVCKLDGDLGLGKPQKVLGIKMIAYTFASLMQGASNSFIGTNSLPDYSPPVWQVSEDKTMIAALAAETIESKNRNYEVSVMDENLHEKWKKAQVIPYPEEKTHLQTLSVNNEGSGIVLSARVYDADKIFLITEKRKRSKRNTGSCRC